MSELQENFTIENGVKEVIIRRGETIDPKDPIALKVDGLLRNPFQYLDARRHLLDKDKCHLIVNNHEGSLKFVIDERDTFRNVIGGKLTASRALDQFYINGTKFWSDKELAKFFRRTKIYFADPAINANIIASLMKFEAKVNAVIEKNADMRGNMKTLFERTVESNVPESFIINVPVFEGYPATKFEVFIGAEANSSEVKFFLESPVLYEIIEKEKDAILNDNIQHFENFRCAILYV